MILPVCEDRGVGASPVKVCLVQRKAVSVMTVSEYGYVCCTLPPANLSTLTSSPLIVVRLELSHTVCSQPTPPSPHCITTQCLHCLRSIASVIVSPESRSNHEMNHAYTHSGLVHCAYRWLSELGI
jgi:hypothetical protein